MIVRVCSIGNERVEYFNNVSFINSFGSWAEIIVGDYFNPSRRFVYDNDENTFYETYVESDVKRSSYEMMTTVIGFQVYPDGFCSAATDTHSNAIEVC